MRMFYDEDDGREDGFHADYNRPEDPKSVDVFYDEEIHATEKARLFEINGQKIWIPKKLIEDEDVAKKKLVVAGWFAEKEALD